MTTIPFSENTPARWYYADDNCEPVGPVTIEALHFLLLDGTITFDTLVLQQEDGSRWQRCHTVFTGEKPLVPAAEEARRDIPSEKKRVSHLLHFVVFACGLWGMIRLLHYVFRDRDYYR